MEQHLSALQKTLSNYDRHLRVRNTCLGLLAVERKHGVAGNNAEILSLLHKLWRLRARAEATKTVAAQYDEMVAYEEFNGRREGYQLLFLLHPGAVNHPERVVELLAVHDIRRMGGAAAYAKRWIAEQERRQAQHRAARDEALEAAVEDVVGRLFAGRKDLHAAGGYADYRW